MKPFLAMILLVALTASGCVSKGRARAEAKAAFYRGQTEAMSRQLPGDNLPPLPAPNTVNVLGPVQVTSFRWSSDMTVLKTIVAAEYIAAGDPSQINIIRSGQRIPLSVQSLLNGNDVPLLPRDTLELKP